MRWKELLTLGRVRIAQLVIFLVSSFALNLALMGMIENWLVRTLGSIAVASILAVSARMLLVRVCLPPDMRRQSTNKPPGSSR